MVVIQSIMSQIEKESGIRKPGMILDAVIFLSLVAAGMTGAFLLIINNQKTWGYVVILFTIFVPFWAIFGIKMMKKM